VVLCYVRAGGVEDLVVGWKVAMREWCMVTVDVELIETFVSK